MSMSTHVIGFRLPDEKWKQMKAIWDAYDAANLDIPDEVFDYFSEEARIISRDELNIQPHILAARSACFSRRRS